MPGGPVKLVGFELVGCLYSKWLYVEPTPLLNRLVEALLGPKLFRD